MAAKRVLIAMADQDSDPSELGIPWKILQDGGVEVLFATPSGKAGKADPQMLSGKGMGPAGFFLKAAGDGQDAYRGAESSPEFQSPITFDDLNVDDWDGLILPGGHAKGIREYLESTLLQAFAGAMLTSGKPVGAICHGVIVLARSKDASTGQSVLHGRKTTGLPAHMELTGWNLTRAFCGDYFLTYPGMTVESEVKAILANPDDFDVGPGPLSLKSVFRDGPEREWPGFVVEDGNYVSARWPGDAHQFGKSFLAKLKIEG